jgi:hypothetical protein
VPTRYLARVLRALALEASSRVGGKHDARAIQP